MNKILKAVSLRQVQYKENIYGDKYLLSTKKIWEKELQR